MSNDEAEQPSVRIAESKAARAPDKPRMHAERALRDSEERLGFLIKLSDRLRPLSDPVEIQAMACRMLGEQLRVDRAYYGDIREDDDIAIVRPGYFREGLQSHAGQYALSDFVEATTALRDGRPFSVSDVETSSQLSPRTRSAYLALGTRALVSVPLVKEGKLVWTLGIISHSPRVWTANEVLLVQQVADRTWEAAERARSAAALLESKRRLERAQEIAHLGNWELDMELDRLMWSDEVYRIFGLKPQEFGATYEAFLEHVHPDDRGAVDAAYSGSLRENRDSYEIEHRVVRKNTGEVRYVHEKCEHFRDSVGRIVRSVGMVHDITDRRRAEAERELLLEQLQASNRALVAASLRAQEKAEAEQEARALAEAAVKMRDEFISIAAHELKNPVTALQGYAQITMREMDRTGSVDPDRLQRFMGRIDEQARRLTKLTEELLNLSRLKSGKLTLSLEETDLPATAVRVVADILHSHPRRKIELRNEGVGPILLDPLRIEQVLVNLLDNAIKFSAPDSTVEVFLREQELGWVELTVRDMGEGVPEEVRPHIFERFFQARPGHQSGGMGIGLFVCREIVEMHGGSIRIEQPEDGGSRFVVHLPRRV